jgi:hypothetical protein
MQISDHLNKKNIGFFGRFSAGRVQNVLINNLKIIYAIVVIDKNEKNP